MKTLYFDLDGTLIQYDGTYTEIYETTLRTLDIEPHGETTYNNAFLDVFGSVEDPFATAIARTEVDIDPDLFSDTLIKTEIEHVSVMKDAYTVLDSLEEEYCLGVLTNGVGRAQRGKLDAADLTEYFDSIVVSGEVGVRKPEPAIYTIAEQRLPANHYLFVADDLDRDVRPAIACGWTGILCGEGNPHEIYSVQHLTELTDLLN